MKTVFNCLFRVVFSALVLFATAAHGAECTEVFSDTSGVNENLPGGTRLTFDTDDWKNDPVAPDVRTEWPASGTELSTSGDYYFKEDKLEGSYSLTVAPDATVRIFVDGDMKFEDTAALNSSGTPDQLQLFVDGKIDVKDNALIRGRVYATNKLKVENNARIEGLVLADDKLDVKDNAVIRGVVYATKDLKVEDDALIEGVTGSEKKTEIKDNGTVSVDNSAVNQKLLSGLCDIPALGGLPVFDNFESYTQSASIDGNNGGSNWGGPWIGAVGQTITDTSDNPLEFLDSRGRRIRSATTLEITGNNNEIATRPLDGTFSGDSVFLSMLVRFTGDITNNDFVALWIENPGFGDSPQFGLKVNIDDFFVRLDKNSDYATDLELGETYLLVAQYSKGSEEYFSNAKLWVNPECESSPPSNVSAERSGFPPGSQLSEFSRVGIRSANLSGSDAFEVGQVAIGTQWTDVVRCSPGPLVEYRMEQASFDGTSGEVIDSSGNDNNATSVGGTQTSITNPAIAGNPGTCRYGNFDGDDNGIIDANAGDYLNELEALTVMAWVYNSDSLSGNDRGIFFTDDAQGKDNRLGLRYDTKGAFGKENNVIKASVFTDECNLNQECLQVETVSGQMVQNQWQHVAMTWTTDGEIKVYIDGSQVGISGTQGSGGTGQLAEVSKLEIGQGAKGQRWQGGIDEFRIFGIALTEVEIAAEMNRAFPCSGFGPSHIRLNHPSTGLTCTPAQDITVEACANSDCSEKYSEELIVELAPDSGWIPGRTVTFTGESDALALRSSVPGSVTLGVASTSIATTGDPGLRCFASGSATESNCEISYAESGFLVDIPDHISGEEVQATIQAVKADETDPVQCVPAFTEEKDVEFTTSYQNPDTGTLAVESTGDLLNGSNLTLAFDGSGTASFPVQYRDVGSVLLGARYEGSGDEAGLVMVGQDDFITRPDRFEVMVPGNPGALDFSTDGIFKVAGESFGIEVRSRNLLGGLTPNFGKESPKESVTLNVKPSPSASVPNLPVLDDAPGGLGLFGQSCAEPDGGKACGNFSWPEVGAFALEPSLASAAYLGTEPVIGESLDYVGRFIPAYFEYSIDPGTLNSKPISTARTVCTGDRGWVYTGEPFSWDMPTEITITPKNLINDVTVQNYAGTLFQLLEAADVGFASFPVEEETQTGVDGSPLQMSSVLEPVTLSTGINGELFYTFASGDEFRYLKPRNSRVPGYTPRPVFSLKKIKDSDGVTVVDPATDLPADFTPQADFEIRYGRITLENGFGPENTTLIIPLKAEVYGDNGFELHEDEACWFYDLAENTTLDFDNSALTPAQTKVIEVADSELILSSGEPEVSPDDYRLRLAAPDPAETEDAKQKGIYVRLGTGNNWLKDYWDAGNPNTLVDPYAWATFGVYRGNDRIIYWREIQN